MAELLPQERLQPSLLDRLLDEEPEKKEESRSKRFLTLNKLKECVCRDLVWLLNSSSMETFGELEDYPYVSKSVINYGMPDLAGVTASNLDIHGLEKKIKEIVQAYEPRLLPNTLKIRTDLDKDKMSHNTLTMDISGEMWALPVPIHLYIKTQVDLESGSIDILNFAADG